MLPTPVRLVNSLIEWSRRRLALELSVEIPAFGIVECHGAHERELQRGHLLPRQAVRLDDAERVLPGVEA